VINIRRLCAVTTLVGSALMLLLPLSGSAQFGGATRPVVMMPSDLPLRNIILKNCVQCHGIDDYAFFALDKPRWEALITTAHEGMDVKLAHHDMDLLLDYLASTFGTDTNPFPREYIPPELTEFFDDDQGRGFLDFECTECHELDRVYESRHTLARWRVIILEMRQRGAELNDSEQMERLAEWLSRVQGANEFE
jgi:hypothetical protein